MTNDREHWFGDATDSAARGEVDRFGVPRPTRAGGGLTTKSLPARPSASLPASQHVVQRREAELAREQDALWSLLAGNPAAAVQASAQASRDLDPAIVQAHAAQGISDDGGPLPYLETIQRAFGPHDVGGIRAHVGGKATAAAGAIGARAYATGAHVAFADTPDLHTAAHEAAHVVQQRGGVHLKRGVGETGDEHEVHADAVADRVVAGGTAIDLLDRYIGAGPHTPATSGAVQRKGASAAELQGAPGAVLTPQAGAGQLTTHHATVEVEKAKIATLVEQVRSGAVSVEAARPKLATIARAMYAPIQAFADAERDPTKPGTVEALRRWKPDLVDALNEVVRASMVIDQAATASVAGGLKKGGLGGLVTGLGSAGAGGAELQSVLTTLEIIADPLGWQPPRDLGGADAARNAHQPCRPGAQAERPDVCPMPDASRAGVAGEVITEAIQILEAFKDACDAEAATLERLLKARVEARKAAVDVFVKVVTLGLGMIAPGPGATVGWMVGGAQIGDKPTDTVESVGKVVKEAIDSEMKEAKAALTSMKSDPENDTISMIKTMKGVLAQHVRNLGGSLQSLDDLDLVRLRDGLRSITNDVVAAHVRDFVARYRQQIEPIGNFAEERAPSGFATGYGDGIAAGIKLGATARPALVKHLHNRGPGGAKERGGRYVFVRWLDADMVPMAGELTPLDASEVEGVIAAGAWPAAQP